MRLIILLACLLIRISATSAEIDRTPIFEAVQDSTGTVWAMSPDKPGQLLFWNDNRWEIQAETAPLIRAIPITIACDASNVVWSVWAEPGPQRQETQFTVLRFHKGNEFPPIGFRALNVPSELHFDSKGRAWLTQAGPGIYQLDKSEAQIAHQISEKELSNPTHPNFPLQRIRALEDGLGRMWFWSNVDFNGPGRLKGVLIEEGGEFKHHPEIAGITNRITSISRKDHKTFWITAQTLRQAKLYEVDVATFQTSEVPSPAALAFYGASAVFEYSGDLFVDCTTAIWRRREASWTNLLHGFVPQSSITPLPNKPHRPWMLQQDRLWLSTLGHGLWLFAPNGTTNYTWENGLPFEAIQRTFALRTDSLLCVKLDQASVAMRVSDLVEPKNVTTRTRVIAASTPLAPDLKGHLWGVLKHGEGVLNEWTGTSWQKHDLPQSLRSTQIHSVATDAHGWVWLLHHGHPQTAAVAILAPETKTWEIFDSIRSSFEKHAARLKNSSLSLGEAHYGVFGPNGEAAIFSEFTRLSYYDGNQWRVWNRETIAGNINSGLMNIPFFTPAGRLAVAFENAVREFSLSDGWLNSSIHPSSAPRKSSNARPHSPPHNPITSTPDWSILLDHGIYWMSWKQQLYKCGMGKYLPQFRKNETHPFLRDRKMKSVQTDALGNSFFYSSTQDRMHEYAILLASNAPPDTRIEYKQLDSDQVLLSFFSSATNSALFAWRQNNGPWSAPQTEPRVTLRSLPNGSYRIEAISIDEHLQPDISPASITFEIAIDPKAQVEKLIAQLKDPEYSQREAAVRGLVQHKETSLPLLRAAREEAVSSVQWWIDSAIQEIERIGSAGSNSPAR